PPPCSPPLPPPPFLPSPPHLPYPPYLPVRIVRRSRARRLRHARRQLPQRRDIVHDPERPPHRRRHEVAMVHLDVGHRRRGEVLLQRLPVLALIERHVGALQRTGVEQSFLLRILAHDVHRLVGRN